MSIPQTTDSTPITSKQDLIQYLEQGCKPTHLHKIGTEHEKFVYDKATLQPIGFSGARSISTILHVLHETYHWLPVFENNVLVGLHKDGANISLEPGGQLELSGAPLDTIHDTCNEVNTHLAEVRQITDTIGAGLIGLGTAPKWQHNDMPVVPKGRYRLMTDYMARVGTMGRDMMYRTCTVQVNLDFSSEADMVKKLRVALALQPVATALYANSPFFSSRNTGYKSWRSVIWQHLDAARTGLLPFVFEDGFGFERWVDYALDVPMYFVYRKGHYIDALGQSFRDFMAGRLPALMGELPVLSDWADHLTTIFPEARIKRFIEMRGADGGAWRRLCALSAFWVGLMYDNSALDAAWDVAKAWDASTRTAWLQAAGKNGLQARVNGVLMRDLARQVLDIANAGLQARGRAGNDGMIPDETHFLDTLRESVDSGQVPADEILAHYYGDWQGDLDRLYKEYSY